LFSMSVTKHKSGNITAVFVAGSMVLLWQLLRLLLQLFVLNTDK
jgi:hypothetical protein